MKSLPTKAWMYVVFCDYIKIYFWTGRLAYGTITRTHCYCAMLQTTIVSNTWPNIIQIRYFFSFIFSGRLYLTNSKLVWLKNAIGTNAVINFKENVTNCRFARSPRKLILFVSVASHNNNESGLLSRRLDGPCERTETYKKYSVTVFFLLYISYKTTFFQIWCIFIQNHVFSKHYSQVNSCLILMKLLPKMHK
jgi:hypothetical protein